MLLLIDLKFGLLGTCYCGRKNFALRCSEMPNDFSCGAICGRTLTCKTHTCPLPCHDGPCLPCANTELMRCYGKHEESMRPCGSAVLDANGEGSYCCDAVCGCTLACTHHKCTLKCHAGACMDCATAPSRITRCPCGFAAVPDSVVRTSCMDAIWCCGRVCDRLLPICKHHCRSSCHDGVCPPCTQTRLVQCRCGSSKRELPCTSLKTADSLPIQNAIHEGTIPQLESLECHQRCSALKSCGRHRCEIACCPSFKDPNDAAGRHVCRLQCGKKLNCGNPAHKCAETCHRGKCGVCLDASFDEWVCPCGRTRVFPPIRCGQKLPACPYVCTRPPPACGHQSKQSHPCHPDSEPCPPCVFLVDASCACGAERRANVRCHLAPSVSCGRVCGAPLSCGEHTCTLPCHRHAALVEQQKGQACGQPCKRPLDCGHTCTALCHPNTRQCPPIVCTRKTTITCPCGRQVQQVTCKRVHGVVDVNVVLPELVCDDVCEKEKRKRLLAEAFGKQHSEVLQICFITSKSLFPHSRHISIKSNRLHSDSLAHFPSFFVALRRN
jgi:transcriptional repressor NF-X1